MSNRNCEDAALGRIIQALLSFDFGHCLSGAADLQLAGEIAQNEHVSSQSFEKN
jgi:hypothetical protein